MKAERKPRIRLEERPKLEECIPLQTPFIINVDPSDKCNLLCKFCPTGDHALMQSTPGRNYGPMSFDLFRKIIDDICLFPNPIKVLRLYKDGEPLSNPRFADMVRYAKESKCCEIVDTTTNAVFLNQEKSEAIVGAGLDRMNISIYGMRPGQYEYFSGRKVDFDALVRNIAYLYQISRDQCVINIKINSDVIAGEDLSQFYEKFGNIADEISDEHIMSCWPGFELEKHGVRVNDLVGIYGQPIKEVLVCPYIFYSFSINSDGTASTCFLDWGRNLLVGDANKESVVDIWRGTLMRTHQEMMLRGERKSHPVCHNCDQLRRGMPDNIDSYRKPLLQKLVQLI